MNSIQLKRIIREEISNILNKTSKSVRPISRLTEGETSEDMAKFGVFTYYGPEGDAEPETAYFTSRSEAIRYAKEMSESAYDESPGSFYIPSVIEVWPKGRDGSWGSNGAPIFQQYFDDLTETKKRNTNSRLTEDLSAEQKRYAREVGLTDDEFRVNMILAKAGFESLSTDYVYSKTGRGGYNANRNASTGNTDKLINVASLEARRIKEVRKAVARGDAGVSLAQQYDFMEEPALVVATVFYDHANELVGRKIYGVDL